MNSKIIKQQQLGVVNGRLHACPDQPKGVSSQSHAPQSRISPLNFHDEKEREFKRLADIIAALSGNEIITLEENYLHAVFKRAVFWRDDLECLWSERDQVCHLRSVARSAYSDWGANRARIEKIRLLFDKGYLY